MRILAPLSIVLVGSALAAACSSDTLAPVATDSSVEAAYAAAPEACWGQATKVFARTGAMGEHASSEATPRLGLANLARALYDAGVISEPTMAALGAFVADALGLSIGACT